MGARVPTLLSVSGVLNGGRDMRPPQQRRTGDETRGGFSQVAFEGRGEAHHRSFLRHVGCSESASVRNMVADQKQSTRHLSRGV
jgi:hypothetical protein